MSAIALLAVIVLALLVAMLVACRVVASRRALASRARLVVLAPDSFDPSLDAVLRFAAQLSRVRRVVGGWFDRRAQAVRVLLDCDADGRMRYSLTVPERALPGARPSAPLTASRSSASNPGRISPMPLKASGRTRERQAT